jgi:hypothetical protein
MQMFTIQMHHGGGSLHIPQKVYVGGVRLSIDQDMMSYFEMLSFCANLG